MKSDPKYKYFMLFKLRRGGRPGQAKAEAEADARGGALQKAEMNGIVGDELKRKEADEIDNIALRWVLLSTI